MELKEKFNLMLANHRLTKKKFADKIDVNIMVLNRSIKRGELSGEIIKSIIYKMPSVDVRFLCSIEQPTDTDNLQILSEPNVVYRTNGTILIEEIEKKLSELKQLLSPK